MKKTLLWIVAGIVVTVAASVAIELATITCPPWHYTQGTACRSPLARMVEDLPERVAPWAKREPAASPDP